MQFFKRANFHLLPMLLPQADLALAEKGAYDFLET